DDVRGALAELVARERVEVDSTTRAYRATRSFERLTSEAWAARIGSLNSVLRNLVQVVAARFLRGDAKARARTLAFRLRAEDLTELDALYDDGVLARVRALDAAAEGDPHAIPMNLTVLWAPPSGEEDES
ncbi:MAG: hypothetical protein KDA28_03785, partial [Phycisphaerales bacterium]|nr:hypothetical protein [Phycisphaerales bacterium]